MKNTLDKIAGFGVGGIVSPDTTLVLFFLALEYGRAVQMISIDGMLMGITIVMVLVLPYFLPSHTSRASFSDWLIGRGAIAIFGVLIGYVFKQSVGVVMPESFRFMPMTFLILASMVSCYVQFYGLMKLRLAK